MLGLCRDSPFKGSKLLIEGANEREATPETTMPMLILFVI